MSSSSEKLDGCQTDWPGPEDDVEVALHGLTLFDGGEMAFWQGGHPTGTRQTPENAKTLFLLAFSGVRGPEYTAGFLNRSSVPTPLLRSERIGCS